DRREVTMTASFDKKALSVEQLDAPAESELALLLEGKLDPSDRSAMAQYAVKTLANIRATQAQIFDSRIDVNREEARCLLVVRGVTQIDRGGDCDPATATEALARWRLELRARVTEAQA